MFCIQQCLASLLCFDQPNLKAVDCTASQTVNGRGRARARDHTGQSPATFSSPLLIHDKMNLTLGNGPVKYTLTLQDPISKRIANNMGLQSAERLQTCRMRT